MAWHHKSTAHNRRRKLQTANFKLQTANCSHTYISLGRDIGWAEDSVVTHGGSNVGSIGCGEVHDSHTPAEADNALSSCTAQARRGTGDQCDARSKSCGSHGNRGGGNNDSKRRQRRGLLLQHLRRHTHLHHII